MRRLAKLVVFLIAVGAAWWFFFGRPQPVVAHLNPEVWVGDQRSGCMYPVEKIMDGKDPIWWDQNRKNWDQFESKQAAIAAGYRECP